MEQTKLHQAIKAIKAGDKQAGRKILQEFLKTHPTHEKGWLWLVETAETRTEKRYFLTKLLEIFPGNEMARQELARLTKASDQPSQAFQPQANGGGRATTRQCPYCAETIKADAVLCRFCGSNLRPDITTASSQPGATSLSWDEVWFSVFFGASTLAFKHILADPKVTVWRAYLWLVSSTITGAALSFMIKLLGDLWRDHQVSRFNIGLLLFGVLVSPILSVVGLTILTALTEWVARKLGGQGSFRELIYARAAYIAPTTIIGSALMAFLPTFGTITILASLLIAVFMFALDITAVQSAASLSGKRAIAAILLSWGILIGLYVCVISIGTAIITTVWFPQWQH
ncbi:MAG: hypothetical protein FOGNACKC_06115 [Anaerolineae bacterium]|nr:hypothetical protein [Anaerolineae bacterium]